MTCINCGHPPHPLHARCPRVYQCGVCPDWHRCACTGPFADWDEKDYFTAAEAAAYDYQEPNRA